MLSFILAAGYLLTVYLLLALAKKTGQKYDPHNIPTTNSGKKDSDMSVNAHASEVIKS